MDDRWAPLTPKEAAAELRELSIRWWVAGGWAADLHSGRQTRQHRDIDIAVLRSEHEALRSSLSGWDQQVAYRGTLRP